MTPKLSKPMPSHIDRTRKPEGCYWDGSGRGRWYTSWRDEAGRQRTKSIAGPKATMAELHAAMEAFNGTKRGTLNHLVSLFEQHQEFRDLAPATQRDYQHHAKLVCAVATKSSMLLGDAPLRQWSRPMCQRLIDQIGKTSGPSSANHALRYLKRLFRWGANRGHVASNYADGVKGPKERKRRTLPEDRIYMDALAYAKECGTKPERTKGSCAPYLWAVMELTYLLRLRGAEALDASDAWEGTNEQGEPGVWVSRRKGSRGNFTRWNPRLRAAWDALKARRKAIWDKRGTASPLHKEDRPIVVSACGGRLKSSSLSSAWDRFIKAAIEAGKIPADARFSLHSLKRRGITKTQGTWADKKAGGGHLSDSMQAVYDFSVPTVDPTEQ